MCKKVVDDYTFTFEFVLDCHKTQELCKKDVSKDASILKNLDYCLFFNDLDPENDSDDYDNDSDVDSDDNYVHIKVLKHI